MLLTIKCAQNVIKPNFQKVANLLASRCKSGLSHGIATTATRGRWVEKGAKRGQKYQTQKLSFAFSRSVWHISVLYSPAAREAAKAATGGSANLRRFYGTQNSEAPATKTTSKKRKMVVSINEK